MKDNLGEEKEKKKKTPWCWDDHMTSGRISTPGTKIELHAQIDPWIHG
jgi:hypothetical protein